jgi:prepilin-type N-terminal cleavage/methylation domain-containing protein
MKTEPTKKHHQAFTLVELLVVIVVILAIAAIVLRTSRLVTTRSKIAQCRAEMSELVMALEEFRQDTGDYPQTDGVIGNNPQPYILWDALSNRRAGWVSKWGTGQGGPAKRVYINWTGDKVRSAGRSDYQMQYIDPWGNAYQYKYKPDKQSATFDSEEAYELTSWGPDGQSNTGDDIAMNQSSVYKGTSNQQTPWMR